MSRTTTEPAAGARAPRRPLRRAWRIARAALVAYLLVVLLCSTFQGFLVFPGQIRRGLPATRVEARPGTELVRLATAGGDRTVALFGAALDRDGRPRPDAARCPTVLFFYGTGSCLRDSAPVLGALRRLGANVMVPEYVGYGAGEGTPSEASCYATADAAYDHLRARPDVDPSRIVAMGWSLGGAVAIDLASRREVAGLVVWSTFTTMLDMAELRYPWLPSRWLLRHRFESLGKIARVRVPALIVHGTDDELIPPSMSDRLAEAAGGPVTRMDLPGAGHDDVFETGGSRLLGAVGAFLDGLRAGGGR
jgi:fermentation-respiration switch protein FrsA (DUF1100 family)